MDHYNCDYCGTYMCNAECKEARRYFQNQYWDSLRKERERKKKKRKLERKKKKKTAHERDPYFIDLD